MPCLGCLPAYLSAMAEKKSAAAALPAPQAGLSTTSASASGSWRPGELRAAHRLCGAAPLQPCAFTSSQQAASLLRRWLCACRLPKTHVPFSACHTTGWWPGTCAWRRRSPRPPWPVALPPVRALPLLAGMHAMTGRTRCKQRLAALGTASTHARRRPSRCRPGHPAGHAAVVAAHLCRAAGAGPGGCCPDPAAHGHTGQGHPGEQHFQHGWVLLALGCRGRCCPRRVCRCNQWHG